MRDDFAYTFNPNACELCGGKCCIGESGYIWVNETEQIQIANFLGLEIEHFLSQYTKSVNGRVSLIEKKISYQNYACIFFDIGKKMCTIYKTRPNQCKTYPFWDSMKTKKVKEVSRECLGVISK